MSPDVFQPDAPGRIVPTQAWEEFLEDGRIRTRRAPGVAFVPNGLPPPDLDLGELLEGVHEALTSAERAIGILEGRAGDLHYARLLSAPLLQREAIISSRIENTIATAREVSEYDAGRTPSRDDPIEVSNYRRAITHALTSELPLCLRLVREMHGILLDNVRGEDDKPGEVRSEQNRIGGTRDSFASARFVPPPPGEPLEGCLSNLEQFWNRLPAGFPRLLSIAMAHYQFEAIHPFEDGNGRLGRAIIIIALCRMGFLSDPLLYISGYFDRYRDGYYELLFRVSTDGDWTSWCRFFLTGLANQAADAADRLEQLRKLRQTTMDRLAQDNAPGRILKLVDHLIETPAMTMSRVAHVLDVKDPTARSYIQRLERIGFVSEITGASYGRIWAATPIFDIIEGDEATPER